MSSLNYSWCSFIPFPCVRSLVTRECRLWWGHSSAFSSLSWTNQVTSAGLQKSCIQGLSPSWSFSCGHTLIVCYPSSIEMPKTAHSTQGGAALVPCRVGQSCSWTGWLCCAWWTPGHGGPFLLPEHALDSHPTCHQPRPLHLFTWGCSPASHPPLCVYSQDYPIPGAESNTCYISYSWWLPSCLVYTDLAVVPLCPRGSPQLLLV